MNGFFTHCQKIAPLTWPEKLKSWLFKYGLHLSCGILKDTSVQLFSLGDIQSYLKSELRVDNISRLHTGMYVERLNLRIDRHVMFCLLVNVIEVLFFCSEHSELC
jgi:hypothetical protein